MARKRNPKSNARNADVESRLGFYDRIAAHFASIARSAAMALVSLAFVATFFIGWGSLSPLPIDIGLPLGGSTPANGQPRRSAEQSMPLIGTIHIYIRPRNVCPR